MTTEPLDLNNLVASTEGQPPPQHVPPQTVLGHIHLHVADLAAAEKFYHEFLGLAVTERSYPGALFFSAGGYHHHLAVNTWAGDRPPPANSIGLISYRLEVPEAELSLTLEADGFSESLVPAVLVLNGHHFAGSIRKPGS